MILVEDKPNHLCKNPNCTNGDDGGRKWYYTCDSCNHYNSWKSVACCELCYEEYISIILADRSQTE